LIVVLDHNISDTEISTDSMRLSKHDEFLEQVSNSISEYRKVKLKSIAFLWNKRDLWQLEGLSEMAEFEKYRLEIERSWKKANYADEVIGWAHSNNNPDDIARVTEHLGKCGTPLSNIQ
jgi:hypothetical protein